MGFRSFAYLEERGRTGPGGRQARANYIIDESLCEHVRRCRADLSRVIERSARILRDRRNPTP